jgi:hypothetical protein
MKSEGNFFDEVPLAVFSGIAGICLRRLKTFLKKGFKNSKNFQKIIIVG